MLSCFSRLVCWINGYIGVTGGLAAPAIGAGLTAIGGTLGFGGLTAGIGGFLTTTGGTIFATSLFGATGAGKICSDYYNDLEGVLFRPEWVQNVASLGLPLERVFLSRTRGRQ